MKKSIIILSAFVALTTVSCKKDYVCSCTLTFSGGGISGTYAFDTTIKEARKSDAKRACVKLTQTDVSGTATQDCKLK